VVAFSTSVAPGGAQLCRGVARGGFVTRRLPQLGAVRGDARRPGATRGALRLAVQAAAASQRRSKGDAARRRCFGLGLAAQRLTVLLSASAKTRGALHNASLALVSSAPRLTNPRFDSKANSSTRALHGAKLRFPLRIVEEMYQTLKHHY